MLAELHLHFHGCFLVPALLRHLAESEDAWWDWYESGMAAAYGAVPPTREIVERYRRGEAGAEAAFEKLFVFGDDDAGDFDRFQAMAALDGDGTERFAISLARSDPWRDWEIVRDLALGPRGETVTGVDFGGREEGHPPKDKAEFFAAVGEFNTAPPDRALAILYHVGESFRDKSLESAVRWVQEAAELGAHRLGHAIALGVDPAFFGAHTRSEAVDERRDQIAYDLRHADGLRAADVPVDEASLREELAMLPREGTVVVEYDRARLGEVRRRQGYAIERVRATGAVVEVCPTSNRRIGGLVDAAHHPVHRFLAAGLPIVVSSDDPGIFGTTLAAELDWVCEHTGGGADLRRALLDTAWRSRSEVLTGRIGVHNGLPWR